MLVCNVVGARPNFMKIAPVILEMKRRGMPNLLVHTGQHYDKLMSDIFLDELGLPKPEIFLDVGSDTHARQTAHIMIAFEEVCQQHRPDLVVVGGDVNSTVAVALVTAKQQIPLAHVEAGLRSFDRTMPEEINRVVTDHIAELLFTTEESANENLRREGIAEEHIHFVGNCMVDTLLKHVDAAVQRSPWKDFGVAPNSYGLLTLHRPSNVDDSAMLKSLMNIINEVSHRLPVLFPVHPRTQRRLEQEKVQVAPSLYLCDPLPYLTFLGLMARARCVLTDSGGIQEEATVLNVPCLTLRWNTERPVTITNGTNRLVGTDSQKIRQGIDEILTGSAPSGKRPPLWDGKAGCRIVDVIENYNWTS
jgi:UDP-N-acetylglucosamine 2-epimerase (non-hydrolysing)